MDKHSHLAKVQIRNQRILKFLLFLIVIVGFMYLFDAFDSNPTQIYKPAPKSKLELLVLQSQKASKKNTPSLTASQKTEASLRRFIEKSAQVTVRYNRDKDDVFVPGFYDLDHKYHDPILVTTAEFDRVYKTFFPKYFLFDYDGSSFSSLDTAVYRGLSYGQSKSADVVYGCAENGSCYGDVSSITGNRKTIHVQGYRRSDGTYVRGHYRGN